jgi:single-stranded DNA-binding protein
MGDRITVGGVVDSAVRFVSTDEGLDIASFRLMPGSDARGTIHAPAGSPSGWYLVTVLGALARGVQEAVRVGDHVVVAGTVRLTRVADGGSVVAELHAEAIGLDVRSVRRTGNDSPDVGRRAIPS